MSTNFDLYSKYYNLLYRNKDYTAEASYIDNCIKKHSGGAKDILEYGSGTGGHGLILQKFGYSILGLERSQKMVDQAKQVGLNCLQADITEFSTDRKFDVIIALFHVISYITDNNSLDKIFKNSFKFLKPGGLFIFDIWYAPAVYCQKPENRIKKVENDEIIVYRFAQPELHTEKNVVDVNYSILVKDKISGELLEFTEKHPMRFFSIPEILYLSEINGFELKTAEEFLTGNQPDANTWGVNFILRKNEQS